MKKFIKTAATAACGVISVSVLVMVFVYSWLHPTLTNMQVFREFKVAYLIIAALCLIAFLIPEDSDNGK